MAFYTKLKCSFQDCEADVIVTQFTICRTCEEVRCQEHDKETNHDCVKSRLSPASLVQLEQKELDELYLRKRHTILLSKLETHGPDIISSAQALRPGHTCVLQLPIDFQAILSGDTTYGAMNIHFPVIFDDGIKWLIRVRQAHNGIPPLEILEQTAISEVLTLKTLRSIGLPVPNAWMPETHLFQDEKEADQSCQNPAFCYFFYEYLSGKSVALKHTNQRNFREVSDHDRRLIEDYGKLQMTLSNHPLPYNLIGCLQPPPHSSTGAEVGPLSSLWGLNRIEPPHFPGPFQNNQERYLTLIDIALSHIRQGNVTTSYVLDAYLWHLCLKELVETCTELSEEPTEVYICHADSKGDILWGDDEGNLTGILDWEMAYVTTKAEAFASPVFCFMTIASYKQQEIFTPRENVLMEFYERSNRPDLAQCVRKGKKYQYLGSIGRYNGWYGISCLPWALLDAFEGTRPVSLQPPLHVDKEWTIYMIERYKNQDNGLEDMLIQVKWEMEKEKMERREGWQGREIRRAQYWGMSNEERRIKKKQKIAEMERKRSEAKLKAEMRKLAFIGPKTYEESIQ